MHIESINQAMHSQIEIKVNPFYHEAHSHFPHHPLLLGSSGGGGHNAAIEALKEYLLENKFIHLADLPLYYTVTTTENNHSQRLKTLCEQWQIQVGSYLMHAIPGLSSLIRQSMRFSRWPVLPTNKEMTREKNDQLLTTGKNKARHAVDMLLDVFPLGYTYAAIWNILQRDDQIKELKKLISLKRSGDDKNHEVVKNYFIHKLNTAAAEQKPYTEIISTQAMALPALCDAVHHYNEKNKAQVPIKIHQYMTDIATCGAAYFFQSLAKLTSQQCQQIFLYGISLNHEILREFGLSDKPFAGFFSIDPRNNPLVRPGFRKPTLHHIAFNKSIELTIQIKNAADKQMAIPAGEKVAAIMLGSQASYDTIIYTAKIAQKNYAKIFVFGGTKTHLKDRLLATRRTLPPLLASKIILLDHQEDAHAAAILARSNLIIIRGGGLSIMEQIMMPHPTQQTILIHNQEIHGKLTSGISWEDDNADMLTYYLSLQGIPVKRTSTQHMDYHLEQIETGAIFKAPLHFLPPSPPMHDLLDLDNSERAIA